MRIPPPSIVASWPAPNYVNPETRGPILLIVETVLIVITTLVVAARVYARAVLIHNFSWDDWLILFALIPTIGLTVVVCLAAQKYSWDVHIWDLPRDHMAPTRKISMAGQVFYLFASAATKLSILLCILRIAYTPLFRRIIYATMVLVTLYVPVFGLILVLQCRPVSGYWDVYNPNTKCLSEGPPVVASVVYSMFFDIVVYILPMPVLWRVQLPLRQRLALVGVFAMGSLVVVAGVLRLYWVYIVTEVTWDLTWEGFKLWMWTAVEIDLGVICACLPTLKPLINKFLEKRAKSKSRSNVEYLDKDFVYINNSAINNKNDMKEPNVDEVPLRDVGDFPLAGRSWYGSSSSHPVEIDHS